MEDEAKNTRKIPLFIRGQYEVKIACHYTIKTNNMKIRVYSIKTFKFNFCIQATKNYPIRSKYLFNTVF